MIPPLHELAAMADFSQVLNLLDGQATPNPHHMMPRDRTQRRRPRECVDGESPQFRRHSLQPSNQWPKAPAHFLLPLSGNALTCTCHLALERARPPLSSNHMSPGVGLRACGTPRGRCDRKSRGQVYRRRRPPAAFSCRAEKKNVSFDPKSLQNDEELKTNQSGRNSTTAVSCEGNRW